MIRINKSARAMMFVSGVLALALPATVTLAQERESFRIDQHYVGASSKTECWENVCVQVYVKKLDVNEGKSEICARFGNQSVSSEWTGGYRVTSRDVYTTFASMSITRGSATVRCELLPVQDYYYVVLRKDRN
jgi:hypothetical protein